MNLFGYCYIFLSIIISALIIHFLKKKKEYKRYKHKVFFLSIIFFSGFLFFFSLCHFAATNYYCIKELDNNKYKTSQTLVASIKDCAFTSKYDYFKDKLYAFDKNKESFNKPQIIEKVIIKDKEYNIYWPENHNVKIIYDNQNKLIYEKIKFKPNKILQYILNNTSLIVDLDIVCLKEIHF